MAYRAADFLSTLLCLANAASCYMTPDHTTLQFVFFGALPLGLAGIERYQASQLILPVWRERGESGRDSVGDGVPTPRLFLLLLRQL